MATDKIKEVATEEAIRVKDLTRDAVQSRAWLYPFKGVIYFASHRDLWKPLTSRLASTLTLSIGVTTFMFLVAYLPQMAIMAFSSGPLAAITAALLTLSESSTIVNFISRSYLIQDALLDTFDGTLVSKGHTALVSDARQVKAGRDSIARLGTLVTRPLAKFGPSALIRYVMYLPLNFIPVVGTAIFIILQGKRNGPGSHSRYFQLKGWSKTQQEGFVEKHRGSYTSFGVMGFMLEMIPFVNLAFAFTNSVGAALWAADLEAASSTAPDLREQAKKAR